MSKTEDETGSPAAIALAGVSFSYDGDSAPAIDNLTVSFPKGFVTAVVGPNGSGKSTLLRIVAGMLVPQSGTIAVEKVQVSDENADRLLGRNIGMVFQNPDSQFIGATVKDDLAFGLENDNVSPAAMNDLITRFATEVGLGDRLDDEPSRLSGGQKQRVALAGVLIRNPAILLLDEATSMLDPQSRRDVFALLGRLRQKHPGLTVIEVTHESAEASQADFVLALAKGQKVFFGTTTGLFDTAAKARALGQEPSFAASLAEELGKQGLAVNDFRDPAGLWRQLCQSR